MPTVQKGLLRRVVSRKSTYAFSFSVCIACFKRNVFRKDRFVDFCLQTCVSKTACLPSMCWRRKERKAQAIKQRPHCDLEEMSQTFRKSRNYEGQSRRIWTLFLAMSVLDSRRCSITDPKSPRIEPRTVQVAIPMFRPCRRRLNCAIDGRWGAACQRQRTWRFQWSVVVSGNLVHRLEIRSRCLGHAAGRSPHLRDGRQSAERSEHSPTMPP